MMPCLHLISLIIMFDKVKGNQDGVKIRSGNESSSIFFTKVRVSREDTTRHSMSGIFIFWWILQWYRDLDSQIVVNCYYFKEGCVIPSYKLFRSPFVSRFENCVSKYLSTHTFTSTTAMNIAYFYLSIDTLYFI